jgi:hypothetical protein
MGLFGFNGLLGLAGLSILFGFAGLFGLRRLAGFIGLFGLRRLAGFIGLFGLSMLFGFMGLFGLSMLFGFIGLFGSLYTFRLRRAADWFHLALFATTVLERPAERLEADLIVSRTKRKKTIATAMTIITSKARGFSDPAVASI